MEADLRPAAIAVVVALVVARALGLLADADLADLAVLAVALAGALHGAVAVAALLPGDALRLPVGTPPSPSHSPNDLYWQVFPAAAAPPSAGACASVRFEASCSRGSSWQASSRSFLVLRLPSPQAAKQDRFGEGRECFTEKTSATAALSDAGSSIGSDRRDLSIRRTSPASDLPRTNLEVRFTPWSAIFWIVSTQRPAPSPG